MESFAADLVDYIDEKFGRRAAWVAGLVLFALVIGVPVGLLVWFSR